MAFTKAERTKLWARVAIYGPSGSGKSYTALRIATGLARKANSRIAAIDTESRSLSKYADRFDFDVDDLSNKKIDSYLASINQCAKEGYQVLVIDSLSHAWKELLEEVDLIAEKQFNGNSWAAWSKGTPKQNKLIDALIKFQGHLIVTMRSKTEWSIGKDKNDKTTVVRSGLSPEQGKGIEYEFDILIDINQSHIAEIQKDRTGKFQDLMIDKPGEEFGESLYDWLNSGAALIADSHSEPQNEQIAAQSSGANEPLNPEPSAQAPQPNPAQAEVVRKAEELKAIFEAEIDGAKLFTDADYQSAKGIIDGFKGKPISENLKTIDRLLEYWKAELQARVEKKMDAAQPEAQPTQSAAGREQAGNAAWEAARRRIAEGGIGPNPLGRAAKPPAAKPPEPSIPAMYSEPEGDDGFMDDIPGMEGAYAEEEDIF